MIQYICPTLPKSKSSKSIKHPSIPKWSKCMTRLLQCHAWQGFFSVLSVLFNMVSSGQNALLNGDSGASKPWKSCFALLFLFTNIFTCKILANLDNAERWYNRLEILNSSEKAILAKSVKSVFWDYFDQMFLGESFDRMFQLPFHFPRFERASAC